MGGESGNFVAEALATADGNFREEAFVGLEVECETGIILFDEEARCLFHGLGADAALRIELMTTVRRSGEREMDGKSIPRCISRTETYHLGSRTPGKGSWRS